MINAKSNNTNSYDPKLAKGNRCPRPRKGERCQY